MSRGLALTQQQVRAIIEGARKAGYAPILEAGNIRIRLVPEIHAILPHAVSPIDGSSEADLDAELAAFEAEHGGD